MISNGELELAAGEETRPLLSKVVAIFHVSIVFCFDVYSDNLSKFDDSLTFVVFGLISCS